MSNRVHPIQFRDQQRQNLRIFYLEDVTAVGCPVEILENVTTLKDHAGIECWLADDVYNAWRARYSGSAA